MERPGREARLGRVAWVQDELDGVMDFCLGDNAGVFQAIRIGANELKDVVQRFRSVCLGVHIREFARCNHRDIGVLCRGVVVGSIAGFVDR